MIYKTEKRFQKISIFLLIMFRMAFLCFVGFIFCLEVKIYPISFACDIGESQRGKMEWGQAPFEPKLWDIVTDEEKAVL